MKRMALHCICLFFGLSVTAWAQSGMTFEDLREKLDPYFAEELIGDVHKQLPLGIDYRIWGWDVGDFSGDGYHDLAASIKIKGDRSRAVQVYLFVDIDGYLTKVGQFEYKYIELPIEVGIAIRDNACHVMQKERKYHWDVIGYRFDNGSLIVLDEFSTKQKKRLTRESYRNFQTLNGYERFLSTRSGKVEFFTEFLSIPSYSRGRYVFKGLSSDVISNSVKFVPSGAFYWEGKEDVSLKIRSAYDDEFVYVLVYVTDDIVTPERIEDGLSERVEVWLDVANVPNRILREDTKWDEYRTLADSGIFSFAVYPGNFAERKAYVNISATDELTEVQRQAVEQVKAVSSLWDDGYVVKLRIPFQLLGFEGAPIDPDAITEFGCTVVAYDIDNEFRPEEESVIATSAFESMNPATYGALLFIPNSIRYGEARNIYADPVAERLKELGF